MHPLDVRAAMVAGRAARWPLRTAAPNIQAIFIRVPNPARKAPLRQSGASTWGGPAANGRFSIRGQFVINQVVQDEMGP